MKLTNNAKKHHEQHLQSIFPILKSIDSSTILKNVQKIKEKTIKLHEHHAETNDLLKNVIEETNVSIQKIPSKFY